MGLPFLRHIRRNALISSGSALAGLEELSNTGCIFFDGANQYASSAFDPSTIGTGDLSVEVWLKPYLSSGATQTVLMLGDTTDGLGILKNNGTDVFQVFTYKASNLVQASIGSVSQLDWSQIVITRTGTTIKVKVNAVEVYSATNANFDMDLNTGCILGANSTPAQYYNGHLDVFRVWSAVLPDETITAIYNNKKPVVVTSNGVDYSLSSSLVVDNLFEELTGTSVADNSGNSNTLTLTNSPTWNQDCVNFTAPAYAATHALSLDGATQIALPFTDFSSSLGTNEFTVYIRSSFSDVTANSIPFNSGKTNNTELFYFQCVSSTLKGAMKGSGGGAKVINGPAAVNDTFYDLVITRTVNASDGTLEFFVDGVSQGTLTDAVLDDIIEEQAYIGKYVFGDLYYHGGNTREIAIWDEVLTDAEILAITTLGDHDLRTDSGNYASAANLINFLVALNLTGTMLDLQGNGSAVYQSGASDVSYP